MLTITLWTLLIWTEQRGGNYGGVTSTQVGGFATQQSCMEARDTIMQANNTIRQPWNRGGLSPGENGVDIKLALCIPVVQERR